jgi:hypothetical protein
MPFKRDQKRRLAHNQRNTPSKPPTPSAVFALDLDLLFQ